MKEDLFNSLLEADLIPIDIDRMSKEDIINEDNFNYIFSINDEIHRERIIMQFEEKAKKEGCLNNFKNILKKYRNQSSQKLKLKHNEVADELLKNNNFALYENKLYMYKDGVYIEEEKNIAKEIIKIVPDADLHFIKEVINNLYLKVNEKFINKDSDIINFKNGLFNLKDGQIYQHTPDFFSINQLNVNYNKNAKRVIEVEDFLNKISSNNIKRKQTILEMIGYSMTPSVKLQKSFILYGQTARNGKSTLSNIITELIGRKNVSNISFKDMNKNIFATSALKGKLLNIGSEIASDHIEDVSIFKMFITGDYLSIEEKFKDKQMISPYVKFIFNANELPTVADKTDGFYRRIQIIPFEKTFTDEEVKDFKIKNLLTKEALEYLAKMSVEAYMTMNGVFSNFEESNKEIDKYRLISNSISTFINDKESNPLYEEKKPMKAIKLYSKYKDYCNDNCYKIIGRNKFYDELNKNPLIIFTEKGHQKEVSLKIL